MTSDTEVDLEIDDRDHGLSVLKRFGCLREKALRCDLTIKVGKNELKVNRELMIVTSDYVAAMFAHDTLEKQTGVVNMKDVEFEFVKKCIDFIYTGKISISFNKCEGLLYVACLMQLWTLREFIGLFLKKHLTVGSFFNIRRMAVKFSIENLQKFCNEFAYKNMDLIAKEKEFSDLDAESILSVLAVKKSQYPVGEDPKVFVILKWIKHDAGNRKEHLIKMMNSVDVKKVSPSYSRQLIEWEPLCFQSADCARMFCLAAMDNHGVKRPRLHSPTYGESNSIVIFDTKSNVLQALYLHNSSWIKLHDFHTDMTKYYYTAVAVTGCIYILMQNRKFFRLNIIEKDSGWTRMKDMLKEHGTNITATVLDDCIYVGGNNSMERYSLRESIWETICSDGVCLNHSVLVAHLGSIYNIGGCVDWTPVKKVSIYSPTQRCWSSASELLSAQQELSAVSFDGKIYKCSSSAHTGTGTNRRPIVLTEALDYYNSSTDTWATFPSSFSSGGKLCVVSGGLYFVNSRTEIKKYNSEARYWQHVVHGRPGNHEIKCKATVSLWLPE